MRPTSITYSRLISKGNFENVKIEIQVEVQDGEKSNEVFKAVKDWVDKKVLFERQGNENKIAMYQRVLDDRRNHTIAQIEEAEQFLAEIQSAEDDDLPF